METIAVVGAGTMGAGIAQVAAQAGLEVLLHDSLPEAWPRARAAILRGLERDLAQGRLTPGQPEAILARIHPTARLEDLATAGLAIEAAPEKRELKRELFRQLDRMLAPDAILASNTSSISITELGAATGRPQQCIGMHFMNPVPVMALVEVIRGLATSDATTETVRELARRMGKTPVEVRDFPGFVSNRVLMPLINEAIFCVYEGVATPEAVDEVMRLGMNHPMGPLRLADLIGLDVCLDIIEVLHQGLGEDKYRPCPLLRQMVAAGRLGRKTGQGFYSYERKK